MGVGGAKGGVGGASMGVGGASGEALRLRGERWTWSRRG